MAADDFPHVRCIENLFQGMNMNLVFFFPGNLRAKQCRFTELGSPIFSGWMQSGRARRS